MIGTAAWLIGTGSVVVALIAARRLVRQAHHRRRHREDSAWAALMVVLADGGEGAPGGPPLSPAITRRLDALACSLVVKLRGADCTALARMLDARGELAAARRRTRSWRARDRARAAELLGATESTSAFPDLVRLLGDRRAQVRVSAAEALGRSGDPYAAAPLLEAMEGCRALPLDVVAAAIIESGEAPANLLSQGLQSSSVHTRALTAELLGYYQVVPATAALARALDGDDCLDVRLRAAGALGRIGTMDAGAALIASMDDASGVLRDKVVSALAEIGSHDAIEALSQGSVASR